MATRTMEPPAVDVNEKNSISAYGTARSTVEGKPLDAEALRKMHKCQVDHVQVLRVQPQPPDRSSATGNEAALESSRRSR